MGGAGAGAGAGAFRSIENLKNTLEEHTSSIVGIKTLWGHLGKAQLLRSGLNRQRRSHDQTHFGLGEIKSMQIWVRR